VLRTSPALTSVPLLAAPVLEWEQLSKVRSLDLTYRRPDLNNSEGPPSDVPVRASSLVSSVEHINSTAVTFYFSQGDVAEARIWNGDAYALLASGERADVCESNVECSAFKVGSQADADRLEEKAVAALEAAGFDIDDGNHRRRLAQKDNGYCARFSGNDKKGWCKDLRVSSGDDCSSIWRNGKCRTSNGQEQWRKKSSNSYHNCPANTECHDKYGCRCKMGYYPADVRTSQCAGAFADGRWHDLYQTYQCKRPRHVYQKYPDACAKCPVGKYNRKAGSSWCYDLGRSEVAANAYQEISSQVCSCDQPDDYEYCNCGKPAGTMTRGCCNKQVVDEYSPNGPTNIAAYPNCKKNGGYGWTDAEGDTCPYIG